ncbi:Rho family guanine nucleotide exchange factor TUS1, partial [Ascoidea rubescens DSM 1968]
DWVSHWKISAEELNEIDRNTQEKQSHIFDLIKNEQKLVLHGKILIEVFGKSFLKKNPPLIPSTQKFYQDAFLTVEEIIRTHQMYLLEPLLNKLNAQGKYISGIAEFYIPWVTKALIPYLKYCDKMVGVRELIAYETKVRKESKFAEWLNECDRDPRVVKAGVASDRLFLNRFISHVMQLPLTLGAIQKKTSPTDPEYRNLSKTIKAVKKLSSKIDSMQDCAAKTRAIRNVASQLIWKNGCEVNMEWNSPERLLFKRGNVSKKRDMWLDSSSHLVLMDNYLLMTEEIRETAEIKRYKVSERPIPIEFLLIQISLLDRRTTTQPGQLMNGSISQDEPITYAFKVSYAGKTDSYTFYTNTDVERKEWLKIIGEAQASHRERIKCNEPFKLKILSDAAFAYEKENFPRKLPICSKGSGIEIALQETAEKFPGKIPRPLMYSSVLSSTSFTYQDIEYLLVGLDYGVYMAQSGEVRNWKRVLELKSISQMCVLEQFNVLVLLSDKILQYYKIENIIPVFKGTRTKTIGQKLSKQDVLFFKVGEQKGSTLLFYSKQKVSSSGCYFKVVIPKLEEATGKFEYFEEHKKFNIQADCSGLTIFRNTFAIHTAKGFEVLSLSMLQAQSIPILSEPSTVQKKNVFSSLALIRKKLSSASCRPMGIFKINEMKELLLVYNEFALICSNHGVLSRISLIPFTFRCKGVAFQDDFLVLVSPDVIEV